MHTRVWPRMRWVLALTVLLWLSLDGAVLAQAVTPKPDTRPDTKTDRKSVEKAEAELARRALAVVTYDGGEVTVGELEDAIASSSPFARQRALDPAALRALLDRSLRFELLAAEAERRGYDKKPSVVQSIKQNSVQAMLKAEVDEKITPQTIPADAIKTYYDEHIDEFVRPEMRRASQILLKDEAEAKALLEQAKTSDMRAFRELARIKSLDETNKLRGGDLGYFDAKGKPEQKPEQPGTTVQAATAKAAFALKTVGDTSPVIKTDAGFVIVKLTGLRQAHTDTPKDADERIRMRLWRERREAAIDGMLAELRKELQPTTKPELIDAIKFDDEPPVAPAEGLPAGFPHTKPPPVVVSKPE